MSSTDPAPGAVHDRALWAAVTFAALSAFSYVLMGLDVLGAGDLSADESPAGITFIAAGGYLLGGALILLRRRWLWVTGAVLNALIMLFFFTGYSDRPSVLLSSGGVTSKVAEILLELSLVYLVATHPRTARAHRAGLVARH